MEKTYTYEITENGYYILINGKKVIHHEENAKAQINELKANEEAQKEEKTQMEQLQQDVTDIQLALVELYELGV